MSGVLPFWASRKTLADDLGHRLEVDGPRLDEQVIAEHVAVAEQRLTCVGLHIEELPDVLGQVGDLGCVDVVVVARHIPLLPIRDGSAG